MYRKNNFNNNLKKETKMLLQIIFPTFAKEKIAKRLTTIMLIFICGIFVISSSAFIYPPQKNKQILTRFKFAELIEPFLKNYKGEKINFIKIYKDITQKQASKISNTLAFNILERYPDNTFKPKNPLHKITVLYYLNKLLTKDLIKSKNLKDKLTQLLHNRNISRNYDKFNIDEYYNCALIGPDDKLSDIANYSFIKPLFTCNSIKEISGVILDAFTKKPVKNAHIIINKSVININSQGNFYKKMPSDTENLEIMCAAEGYKNIIFKKQCRLKDKITILLTPETINTNIKLKTKAQFDNTGFKIYIDNKILPFKPNKPFDFKIKLIPGYHTIIYKNNKKIEFQKRFLVDNTRLKSNIVNINFSKQ